MRVTFPTGTRSFPTDRNPLRIALGQPVQQAGGGSTTIVTYTVPAARRAILVADLGYTITTLLAAGQNDFVQLQQTGQLTGGPTLYAAAAAPVNQHDAISVPEINLQAGDTILIVVTAGAGAGVIQASGALHGVEYDA